MASVTWKATSSSSAPYLVLTVSQKSQSISGNYSNISYSLVLYRPYNINSTVNKNYSIKINGSTVKSGSTTIGGSGTKTIASGSTVVQHNSDGTKKNMAFSFTMDFGITWSGVPSGDASGSGTMNLTTIPRASTISSFPNFQVQNDFTVTVSRASSAFTHTLRLYVGSTLVAERTGVTTSKTFDLNTTEQEKLYTALVGKTSISVTMRCYTYNGSTLIGSYTTKTATASIKNATISSLPNFTIGNNFTVKLSVGSTHHTHKVNLYVGSTLVVSKTGIGSSTTFSLTTAQQDTIYKAIPSKTSVTITARVYTYSSGGTLIGSYQTKTCTASVSSSIKPTFTTITHDEYVSSVKNAIGSYVQTRSRLSLAITGAAGAKYSTISSYKITFDGSTFNSRTATSGYIKGSGSLQIVGTVTDSRGRTASKTVTVTVLAYAPPKINSFTAIRCDSEGNPDTEGEYIKVYRAGTWNDLSGKNPATITIKTKPRTSSSYVTKNTSNDPTSGFAKTVILNPYSIIQSYDVRIEVKDLFNTTISTKVLPTGQVTMSWGRTGIGIGKIHEGLATLEVGGDLQVDGAITTKDPNGSTGNKIFDFANDYSLWSDDAGAGETNTRLWFAASNGGEIVFGPRGGSNYLHRLRVRANNSRFEGDITYTGDLITSSDRSLKKNIKPLNIDALKIIENLKAYEFNYLIEGDNTIPHFGLMYDEAPEELRITGEKPEDNGVNTTKMIWLNTVGIQQLAKENNKMKMAIVELYKKIGNKEEKIMENNQDNILKG